jgi:hypothetical protein
MQAVGQAEAIKAHMAALRERLGWEEPAAYRQKLAAPMTDEQRTVASRVKTELPSIILVGTCLAAIAALLAYGSFLRSSARAKVSPVVLDVAAFLPIMLIALVGIVGAALIMMFMNTKAPNGPSS